jgi:hypothetical protein
MSAPVLNLPLAPVDWLLEAVRDRPDVQSAEVAIGGSGVFVLTTSGRRLMLTAGDVTDNFMGALR